MSYNKKIQEFKNAIINANDIVIIPHHNPDGDAIGAALGLQILLKKMHKKAIVVSPSKYPEFLQWLPDNNNVLIYPYKKNTIIQTVTNADLIFYVDFNSFKRLENFEESFLKINRKAKTILIDHHPEPLGIADICFSDTTVSSTSELVYKIIEDADFTEFVNTNIAECLFTGIITDTGLLNYNSSNPQTFEIVSKLLTYKIDKQNIIDNVYNNFSANRMRLMGYCLNEKMEVLENYNSAVIWLNTDELQKYDFKAGDTEGFVNLPLSIKNIDFSAIFIEKKDFIKTSFRSKGSFPANDFAKKYFNGGGHLNAAGGKCFLSLSESIEKFKKSLIEFYENNFK